MVRLALGLLIIAGGIHPPKRIRVHGLVLNSDARVAKATVTATFENLSFGATTNARGEFTLDMPRGTNVTVIKGDLYGRGVVESRELIVKLSQLPL